MVVCLRSRVLVVVGLLALSAGCECGGGGASSAGERVELAEVEAPALEASGARSVEAEAGGEPEPVGGEVDAMAIGYASLPVALDDALLTRVRAALAVHARGDYEASEAAFRALVEAHPDYPDVRFDRACALARLGRVDDARAEVELLLALDLPSFAPRLESDEDLASLREGEHDERLRALRERLEAAYREALRDGMEVVRVVDVQAQIPAGRRTVQAGVWLPSTQRFVPMGRPFTRHGEAEYRYQPYVSSTLIDRTHGVVLTLGALSTNREADDVVNHAEAIATEVVTGRELGSVRVTCPHDECRSLRAHAAPGGAIVQSSGEYVSVAQGRDMRVGRAVAEGARFDAAQRPSVSCAEDGCTIQRALEEETAPVSRERSLSLRWDETSSVEVILDPAHRLGTRRSAQLVRDTQGVWVATLAWLDHPDFVVPVPHSAVSYVERSSGRVSLVASGRASLVLRAGPDGSIYLQVEDALQRHEAGSLTPQVLPAGLLLDPGPHGLELVD